MLSDDARKVHSNFWQLRLPTFKLQASGYPTRLQANTMSKHQFSLQASVPYESSCFQSLEKSNKRCIHEEITWYIASIYQMNNTSPYLTSQPTTPPPVCVEARGYSIVTMHSHINSSASA